MQILHWSLVCESATSTTVTTIEWDLGAEVWGEEEEAVLTDDKEAGDRNESFEGEDQDYV